MEAKAIKWDGSTFFVPDKVASGADAALKYHYFTAVLKSTASSSALAETKINFFVSRFNVGPSLKREVEHATAALLDPEANTAAFGVGNTFKFSDGIVLDA